MPIDARRPVMFAAAYDPFAELFCAPTPLFLAWSQSLGWFWSRASRALDVYDIHRITASAEVHTVHPNPNSVRDAAIAAEIRPPRGKRRR